MNTLLESYLEDARANLTHLPSWKRDLELMELRSHLEADVAARVELGVSEAAATRETLTQFGDVREVCGGLVQAEQREKLRVLDTPLRISLLASILFFMVGVVTNLFATSFITACLKSQIMGSAIWLMGTLLTAGFGLLARVAVAWHIGRMAPRNGILGVAVGYVVGLMTSQTFFSLVYPVVNPGTRVIYSGPLPTLLLQIAPVALCMVAAAWIANRTHRIPSLRNIRL